MRNRKWNGALVLVLLILPALACQTLFGEQNHDQGSLLIEYTDIDLPEGEFSNPQWLGENVLVGFSPGEREHIYDREVWLFETDTEDFSRLNLPLASECSESALSGFIGINVRSVTEFSYLVICRFDRSVEQLSYLMLYDADDGNAEPYWDQEFAIPPRKDIGWHTWRPNGDDGIAGDGLYFSGGQLYWFSQAGFSHADVGLVTAANPVWSPDGETIAFFGSTEMQSIFYQTDDAIYLMDANGDHVRKLLDGPLDVADFSWSPDSKWLIVSGILGDGKEERRGLWLVQRKTGDYWYVSDGLFSGTDWSANGEVIVAARQLEGEFSYTNLALLDIGDAIRQLEE